MKKTTRWKMFILSAAVGLAACDKEAENGSGLEPPQPQPVIFDTDLDNSTDDVLAMQALLRLQQQGVCKVIGVMTSRQLEKARE